MLLLHPWCARNCNFGSSGHMAFHSEQEGASLLWKRYDFWGCSSFSGNSGECYWHNESAQQAAKDQCSREQNCILKGLKTQVIAWSDKLMCVRRLMERKNMLNRWQSSQDSLSEWSLHLQNNVGLNTLFDQLSKNPRSFSVLFEPCRQKWKQLLTHQSRLASPSLLPQLMKKVRKTGMQTRFWVCKRKRQKQMLKR